MGLYKYDYLDATEMGLIFEGKKLDKEHVREYDPELNEYYQASDLADMEDQLREETKQTKKPELFE